MHYEVDDFTAPWQQIPDSKLLVLPRNSYHVAVNDAELCAKAALEFIASSSGAEKG